MILPMLGGELAIDELTPAQRSFAQERDAQRTIPGALDGQVFVYEESPFGTCRWLVDREGVALDLTRFTD